MRVFESTITMRHYGYVAEMAPAKFGAGRRSSWNWSCGDRPGQIYYLIEFGRTLLMLEDQRGHEILGQAGAELLRTRPSCRRAVAGRGFADGASAATPRRAIAGRVQAGTGGEPRVAVVSEQRAIVMDPRAQGSYGRAI